MAKFEKASYNIDVAIMGKETKSGFGGHGHYKDLLGEILEFVSYVYPNLQAHPNSNCSGNGAGNTCTEKTSKNLIQLEGLSGESCPATSLKPPKNENMLLRELIAESALSTMIMSINVVIVETFLLGTFGRIGPVSRAKMKWPNTKLDQGNALEGGGRMEAKQLMCTK
ncbi:hypothetical protein M5689_024541 [Euphorbia peplus]|nr:hypothetical protein M5689_024541 [Euphorbia peplus]